MIMMIVIVMIIVIVIASVYKHYENSLDKENLFHESVCKTFFYNRNNEGFRVG